MSNLEEKQYTQTNTIDNITLINNLSAIIALDLNNGFSKNGNIPWKSKTDMTFFKDKTMHNTVIMGYNTLLSLPNSKPLMSRHNIVITKDKKKCINNYNQLNLTNLEFCNFEEAINIIKSKQKQHFFIIGGIQIFKLFFPYIKTLFLTRFKENYSCDKFLHIDKYYSIDNTNNNILLNNDELTIYEIQLLT